MYSKEQYKRLLMFATSLANVALLSSAFAVTWYLFYSDTIVQPFFRKGNWLVVGIYAVMLYFFTRVYGGYKIGHLKLMNIMYSQMLSTLLVNGLTYCQISLIGRRWMLVLPLLVMTVIQGFLVIAWSVTANRIYYKLFPAKRVIVIYGSAQAGMLIYKFGTRREKFKVEGMISADEDIERIKETILQYEAVLICEVKSELRNKLLKFCFDRSIRTYINPKLSDIIVRGGENIDLFDTPLLLCRNFGLTFEQRFVKRTIDLLLSGVAIVAAAPFMLVIAAAIKLYDRGPVLYSQERLTLDGKVFQVYKFRSMIVDAEKDGEARLASQNDDRITPVGKFLRKIRFDELPQLLNIFRGDMSIVGPRPERPEIAAQYEENMPEFSFRLKVKAGLTGYAQVFGKYNTTPLDKLKWDLTYIGNYSLLLDLKLILMTVKILFLPDSTEGIPEGAVTAEQVVEELKIPDLVHEGSE